ncbi:GGDEF domain-containing protein [Gymnodinialimonas sp. 2305UL16-5]|uniref:GGDEF domain-containing protein n=1 Tax=Gymnodinialimonas mytili TaxID=3126503 RepID=UPI0030A03F21
MTAMDFPKDGVPISSDGVFDQLMPMHLRLSMDGIIEHAGPTIRKMLGDDLVGQAPFFSLFGVHHPVDVMDTETLFAAANQRIGLILRRKPDLPLRAHLARLPGEDGAIVDISLGLSFVRAVAEFSLTLRDFAPNDQTVDLLYLHEANASTARLSRHLTERLKAAHASAEHQARTDVLTGLPNRRAIDLDLERILKSVDEQFTLLQVDLDLFKEVNDTYGHPAGDAVLRAVGRIFEEELRRNDIPSRIGGDEFLVVLRDVVEPAVAGRIASRIIQRIEQPVTFGNIVCQISASVGIVTSAQYSTRPSLKQMMEDVDAALYRAKNDGRGRYALHASLTYPIQDRRSAIDRRTR